MAAFARDAISAARRTPLVQVSVVGDRTALAAVLDGLDVPVVPDDGGGDLNQALRAASARLQSDGLGIAVLLADLPCLRTADLEAALEQAVERDTRMFVADHAGTGTTLLVAPPGHLLDPRFGHGSAAEHAATGAKPVEGDLGSLRLDVDTTEDLDRAMRFGVGPDTERAVAALHRDEH